MNLESINISREKRWTRLGVLAAGKAHSYYAKTACSFILKVTSYAQLHSCYPSSIHCCYLGVWTKRSVEQGVHPTNSQAIKLGGENCDLLDSKTAGPRMKQGGKFVSCFYLLGIWGFRFLFLFFFYFFLCFFVWFSCLFFCVTFV